MRHTVVLVGPPGSGKTEVGRRLAERTGRPFLDTDELVEAEGGPIPEIFAREGERGFRRRERRAVEVASRTSGAVIATGGGAVLDARNVRELRRHGVLVYLRAAPDELASRLGEAHERPLLAGQDGEPLRGAALRERLRALLAERERVYVGVCDYTIAADGRPERAAEEIRQLTSRPAKVRTVRVEVAGGAYPVRIRRRGLVHLAELVRLPEAAERVMVVSHPRIRRLWGAFLEAGLEPAGLERHWFTFGEGEDQKTPDTAERLHRRLAAKSFHRHDVLVALGGGVVGDLTGYVASTFGRGIAYVQAPTSLLAMVDASVGGKTGVNLPEGKNLVGTFHHPLGVVADLDVLTTLPDSELRGGLAEVVKYAFIADPSLGSYLLRHHDLVLARAPCLARIVERSVRIKARVVAADEREQGLRAILNYGHTLGHALEAAGVHGRGPKLHHGQAVAIGMVYAAEVARLLGDLGSEVADDHRRLLRAVGLPTSVGEVSWKDVYRYMRTDKKYRQGLRMVLLDAAGLPVVRAVEPEVLREAFAAVRDDGRCTRARASGRAAPSEMKKAR